MRRAPILAFAFLLPISEKSLWSQATLGTGSIHGIVLDSSRGAISDARITLLETSRELQRESISNSAGSFVFPDIPATSYRLRVSKSGFDSYELNELRVGVGQTASLEIQLRPGEIHSVVTVSAESKILLETESNAIGSVVNSDHVQNLPLNGRSFLQLALLAGGSNEIAGRSSLIPQQIGYPDRGVVIAGNLAYMSGYLINGIDTRGSRQGESAVNVSVAGIDQFKVQESFFLPDQGPNPGLVNVVTRSGTNQVHGQVFHYIRNQVFDARNFFARAPEDLKRNQFGGAVGGPLLRDRLWFFAHYEGLRQVTASATTAFTPTQAMFAGDFREAPDPIFDPDSFSVAKGRQPFAGNLIPRDRINRVSRNLLQYYIPGSSLSHRPVNLFGATRSTVSEDQGGGRMDVALTRNQMLFGQFIETHSLALQGGFFPLRGTSYPNRSRFSMLQHTWALGPALVATTRFGFTRYHAFQSNEARDLGPILTAIGVQNTFDNRGVTSITFQNFTGFGRGNGDVGNMDDSYQFDYGLHYIRGRHDIQVGIGIRRRYTMQQNANSTAHGSLFFQANYTAQVEPSSAGGFSLVPQTGNDFADFLLGTPSLGQMAGLPGLPYRTAQYMPYIQDTWKIRSNLTLNYGVGWFLAPVPEPRGLAREWAHGFDMKTGRLTYAALGQVNPRILSSDRNNIAPRFGLAWSPRFLPRTVVRAGAGIYYSDIPLSSLQHATLAPPFASAVVLAIDPLNPEPPYRFGRNLFPAIRTPVLAETLVASLAQGASARIFHPRGLTPFIQQWNFSILHSLSSNYLLELAYLGSNSHRLTNVYDLAQCRPDADNLCRAETRSYSNYSSLMALENNGNSSYHAGIARFQYQNAKGVNLRAEYTYAKALTDTSEIGTVLEHQIASCRRCEKALTAFDQRSRLVVSGTYAFPFGRGKANIRSGWMRLLLGGWQSNLIASFASGPPIDQIAPNTTASALIFHRPDRLCDGRDDRLSGNLRNNGFLFYNPDCFAPASPGRFGNAGRNIMGSPGINNWDIGFSKQFPFAESKRLDFRTELFNAWNHAQFGAPNRFLGPNLGRVSTARAPRLIQMSLQFHW